MHQGACPCINLLLHISTHQQGACGEGTLVMSVWDFGVQGAVKETLSDGQQKTIQQFLKSPPKEVKKKARQKK